MKKKFWILGAIVLLLVLTAVGVLAENVENGIENSAGNENGAEYGMEKGVENESEKGVENGSDESVTEDDGVKEETEKTLLSSEGFLTGRIDSHSVEIEIDGEPRAFALSEDLRDSDFARGEISFQFYVDDNGRSVISQADFQEPRDSEVHTAEGIFSGLADSHTVEMIIDGEPRAFGLDENITFTGIEEGEELFIAYQEDETGRQVIIKVEKVF